MGVAHPRYCAPHAARRRRHAQERTHARGPASGVEIDGASGLAVAQLSAPDGLLTAIARGDSLDVSGDGFAASLKVYRGEGSPVKQPDGTSYRAWFFDLEITPRSGQ